MKEIVADKMLWIFGLGSFLVGFAGQLTNAQLTSVQAWLIAIAFPAGNALLGVWAYLTKQPEGNP